jgi:hypothetical protein
MAADILENLKFAFENHEEAWIFAFACQPLTGRQANIRGLARQPLPFCLFDIGEDRYLGQIFRADHPVLLA